LQFARLTLSHPVELNADAPRGLERGASLKDFL